MDSCSGPLAPAEQRSSLLRAARCSLLAPLRRAYLLNLFLCDLFLGELTAEAPTQENFPPLQDP